jgi:hypothetical protein
MCPIQKPEKRRDSTSSRLKKIWRSPKPQHSGLSSDSGGESSSRRESKCSLTLQPVPPVNSKPACSLPLLQIWPSQDSPRSEPDGQSFIFSVMSDDNVSWLSLFPFEQTDNLIFPSRQTRHIDTTFIEHSPSSSNRRHSLNVEHGGDSGIDSVQASPSPIAQQSNQPIIITSSNQLKQSSSSSPTPSERQQQRRFSQLLHPDHARIIRPPTSPDNVRLL